ncbi:DUF2087 domain-containing protein [Aminobacter sp. NyZ550]|jgi:hypothetical protein|uniref:DUF2087 domain-containing protein n=1 Tax=unclassified Aminobacter TaxID=2644704 RepID=UPI0021D60F13|nr:MULTISPECIES: DUF2087 domain-containing protein [unclassified Aminobacter]WAX97670.1 DUF2087 domain-containing protein [Aminobacter sp. NyZ550]BBD38843.1 hypothetical protein Amn_37230 [Aminobacter sp. SS-2016]
MTGLITDDGVVTRWPAKAADRLVVLDFLVAKFETGRDYSEREVNDVLKRYHSFGDWALLRRELFESGRFSRNPVTAIYRRADAR